MLGLWLAIGNAVGSTVILPALHGPDPTSTVGAEIVYASSSRHSVTARFRSWTPMT